MTISESVVKLTSLIKDVSQATQEQSSGLLQINQAMNSIDRTTQQNALTAQQLADSSGLLTEATGRLMENIEILEKSVGANKIRHTA